MMLKISLVALFLATIEQELFGATSPNILPDGCPAVVSDVLRALGSLCALSLSCLVVRRYRLMRKLMLIRSSGGDAVRWVLLDILYLKSTKMLQLVRSLSSSQ